MARAVSYLALSRTGLTEAELADLLAREAPDERVPTQVDVETLLLDLRRFLVGRTVAGSRVLFWTSRHFQLVVVEKFLGAREARREIHAAMAEYFGGRSPRGGSSKPNEDAVRVEDGDPPGVGEAPGQTFGFSFREVGRLNSRKVLELPHHLRESAQWAALERGLLMSFAFHGAAVRAGLLADLVAALEGDEGACHFCFPREKALLASVLRSRVQSSPLHLPSAMETGLLPYLEVFPELEGYVREIGEERRRAGSGLGVSLCPAPSSVPSVRRSPRDEAEGASVREAAATECGIVAEVMDDGSARVWKGFGRHAVRPVAKEETTFTGVKSSGRFVLFSTRRGELLLWDVTRPEMFLRVIEDEASRETANRVEGFAACREKVFVWRAGESSVSSFDVSDETSARFQCRGRVTGAVCSSGGGYLYCGLEGGALTAFDTDTGGFLGASSTASRSAITWMLLREDERELACVDGTGSVSVWDVASKTNPPRLVRESSVGGDRDGVQNIDYSREIGILLVCRSHQVALWDTRDWEPRDRFLVPRGRAFVQAALCQQGRLFLALLDARPFVLAWRLGTGECVLSLETHERPRALLTTASGVVCVAGDGRLTAWDSGMIAAAAAAPKMGRGVTEVAVDRSGACFYTSDGSEAVWRWSWDTGLPRDNFLHDAPVGRLRLSPDGVRLVTLSAGEVYVWRTDTGRNVLRVSGGGGAADVLIAPNGNVGVTISERGSSRVWKLEHGSVVCVIRARLSDAEVSPASTFLLGLRRGDLLAASLWSGAVDKRFSRAGGSERVVAFRALSGHPDFAVVMAASGAVFTWKVAEETLCRHFRLPYRFRCRPRDFQATEDGSFALLSADGEVINLLDLSRVRLCSLKAEGPVVKACLDKTGCYAAYIYTTSTSSTTSTTTSTTQEDDLRHPRPVLAVVRLADGETIGRARLPKNPSALVVCERRRVFVGFDDGSVGAFSISDAAAVDGESDGRGENPSRRSKRRPCDGGALRRLPRETANVIWP